ncbi:hypothetical protein GGI43DRAFT_394201 [Trichoderma evansii]
MKRRLNRLRHGNQAEETQRDEELGVRIEEDANDQRGAKAVARPAGQAPEPLSNAAPSSADLALNEPQEGLGLEAQYLIDNALPHQKYSLAKSIQQTIQENEQHGQQQAQVQQHNDDAGSAENEGPLTPQNTRTPPPANIKDAEETT